jgi:hypothetical protein
MTTPPGLLAHSRQHKRLLNGIVLAPGLHMRQTRAGRVVAAWWTAPISVARTRVLNPNSPPPHCSARSNETAKFPT